MALINPGQTAPEFTLLDQFGKRHALSDYRGRIVVIYFYPEDSTPLCTGQACQFRDHHAEFKKIKAVVLGISPDDQVSHAAFASAHALPFTLLSDVPDRPLKEGGRPPVCERFGVWGEKLSFGRRIVSMLRTTYLIDPDGKVARRWDRVRTPGHASAVLAAAKALHAGERLTVLGKPRKVNPTPAKRGTRSQGGHAGYSGVLATKSKNTRTRSTVAQAKARRGPSAR